ncbi:phosphoserine aminotransferase [Novimethylophilus kurashikiensis]|uniref:Phosphoserine aminotransferase n=1 Tax=Novimethylophilus kurashikiensis TaxID=1825523 RepID=A0A2R5FAA2_9PROT|nr:3-phosphoserine/phosphohydroxythreonine transaminase [Novimethylophilus kurashikiensis]GBG15127.1 phosphoserine aminotransferase [Novimethylophilus kurashikiensis]
MARVWNFSAGPSALPLEVLEQARDELTDWHGSGMSVMEMSHRGKDFGTIIDAAEADLRDLLDVPTNYKVLFLQGGATQLFSQIPLNLADSRSADYLVTGSWSKKAVEEAQRVAPIAGAVRVAGSTAAKGAVADGFTRFLRDEEISLDPQAAFLHVCTNETIYGVEVQDDCAHLAARAGAVPLVADMSSHILSRPVDVSRYGMIYAGAQKNIGPSGLVIAIVREDLLGRAVKTMPSTMDFAIAAENGSMLNTPPTFGIYVSGLVFQWLKRQGGVAAMEQINRRKAELLYGYIDGSNGFYRNPVDVPDRSRMNVPFTLQNSALDDVFLKEAQAAGLHALKGHKSVGGMRASIYNAMPLEGVQALVEFMQDFARRNG